MPKCVVCGGIILVAGRRVLCSPRCARKRQLEQIRSANRLRREEERVGQAEREPVPCGICSRPFVKRHNNAKYCGDPCRKVALDQAVQRQSHRRKLQRVAS